MPQFQLTITVPGTTEQDATTRASYVEEILKYIDTPNLEYLARKAKTKGINGKIKTAKLTNLI